MLPVCAMAAVVNKMIRITVHELDRCIFLQGLIFVGQS